MKVNGTYIKAEEQMTVGSLLEQQGYNRMRVAVEKNGEILPKAEYDSASLSEADELEIVSFVGGG